MIYVVCLKDLSSVAHISVMWDELAINVRCVGFFLKKLANGNTFFFCVLLQTNEDLLHTLFLLYSFLVRRVRNDEMLLTFSQVLQVHENICSNKK
jgi:hypothetical protein